MSNLFVFLFLITLALLIINLIKPGLLNQMIKRELSRKQSSLSISAIALILFILIGITAPPAKHEPKTEVKGETVVQEVSPSPVIEAIPSPSPTPSPIPTPITQPTPILTPIIQPSPKQVIKPSPTPASTTSIGNSATVQTNPAPNTSSGCDPSYPDVCIPAGSADYDCEDGSGNGPNYIKGPIKVLPSDPHDLDRDGDGIGCEN